MTVAIGIVHNTVFICKRCNQEFKPLLFVVITIELIGTHNTDDTIHDILVKRVA